jgi:hypothetical protein
MVDSARIRSGITSSDGDSMNVPTVSSRRQIRRTAPAVGRRPGSLILIGSGIKAINQFTLESEAYLRWADAVYFCVADPATERWILEHKPDAVDLYTLYDNDKNRAETYIQMSELMLQSVRQGLNVVGIFYGHPGVFVNPSHRAIAIARQEGHEAVMLPAVSALDCLFADLGIDPSRPGCQVIEATDLLLRRRTLLTDSHVVIFQVGSVGDLGFRFAGFPNTHLPLLVSYLQSVYGNDYEIVHYIASQYSVCLPIIDRIRLSSFSDPKVSQKVTGISTFYIPPRVIRGVDRATADALGLAKYQFPSGDLVVNSPFMPSPAPYTRKELEIIARLDTHRPPPDYRPTRPSAGLFRLVKDLSLDPSVLEQFLDDSDSLLQKYPELSMSDRKAVVSRHYGILRRAMQRTSKEVALDFVRRILKEPALARRYQVLQNANGNPHDGADGVRRALRNLGYDTSAEDVELALSELMNEDLSLWEGEYEMFCDGRWFGTLSVRQDGITLSGKPIEAHHFSGGVLTWTANEPSGPCAALKFFVITDHEDEPLPDRAYVGPQFKGKLWLGSGEPPSEDNVTGKVGAFSADSASGELEADPLEMWTGNYQSHLISREGSWEIGPSVTISSRDKRMELHVDGVSVARWAYSDTNLSWIEEPPRYSGSITFFRNQINAANAHAEFVGRIWQGTEQPSPSLNAIGQRETDG